MSFHLFERFGIEIEYMIVHENSLGVFPVCDQMLVAASGGNESEIEVGNAGWSNELVLHVVEFKTKEPVPSLAPVASDLHAAVRQANQLLRPLGGKLLPTAMHPFMDPVRDTELWPNDNAEIYGTFNRIFDCRGHGWSNLQSVHINLPFSGDAEFERLHSAIRLVLPLLPMLAASSPIVEGRLTGKADNRLAYYRNNCVRLPIVTAQVIPENVGTEAEYRRRILEPIAAAVEPFDHQHVLDAEWVNARGAITRFSRGSIEIRVLDVQECPAQDLAIVHAVVALVKALVQEQTCSLSQQRGFDEPRLLTIFEAGVEGGSRALISDQEYLSALGVSLSSANGRLLWELLISQLVKTGLLPTEEAGRLEGFLRQGTLSERIAQRLQASAAPDRIRGTYGELADCLALNAYFDANS